MNRTFGAVRILAPAISLAFMATGAEAQLVKGQVISGQASITMTAQSALIQQTSPKAIITWGAFSIPQNYSVVFQQPSASAIALNRVLGGSPSYLLGSLSANGQVWLINPAGIVTGAGAQLSAAGLLLSTIGISNSNFLGGNYVFDQPGADGAAVLNHGNHRGLGRLRDPGRRAGRE